MDLPPGFRFHPTDEEIITHYLTQKVVNTNFAAFAIGEADLNKSEPWDLPKKAKMGEKEWYFFCQRDRKYPTGMRTNRATEAGYWKATGKDKEIYRGKGCLVGMKKTLVFYRGRAPKGEKTNWVMHEYRLEGKFSYYNLPKSAKDEWVVCRVFHKNSTCIKKNPLTPDHHHLLRMNSFGDHHHDQFMDCPSSLPPLMDSTFSPAPLLAAADQNEFKTSMNAPSRSSDGNYPSHHDHNYPFSHANMINNNNNNNYLHQPQINTSIFNPQNQVFSFPTSLINPGYHRTSTSGAIQSVSDSGFETNEAILRALAARNEESKLERQCKVEQFSSNQSMVSQETGVSATEISSVVSKHENMACSNKSSYDDIADLDCLWDY